MKTFIVIIIILNISCVFSETIYHISSNEPYITLKESKYRESVSGKNNAQFVFESNNEFEFDSKYEVVKYENYELYKTLNRWTKPKHELFTYYINANRTIDSAFYCHNINVGLNKNTHKKPEYELIVNNKIIWRGYGTTSSIFIPLNIEDDKIYLKLRVVSIDNVDINSSKENGYKEGASSWLWFKTTDNQKYPVFRVNSDLKNILIY